MFQQNTFSLFKHILDPDSDSSAEQRCATVTEVMAKYVRLIVISAKVTV